MKKLLMAGVVMGLAMGTVAYAADPTPTDAPDPNHTHTSTTGTDGAKGVVKPKAAASPMEKKAETKKEEPKKDETKKEETKPAAAAGNSDWKVEGKTCKSLTNRECADSADSFTAADGTVYAWTKVNGPKEGGEIHHVWFKGDEQMGDVTLKIGGSPWRTYSKKSLGDKSQGDWRVEVRDANGAVLETLKFSVK